MRTQEAARLLKERRLTVSEIGYQLGFTNLSLQGWKMLIKPISIQFKHLPKK
jgi:AraC-like DNA-binding protein